MTQTEIIKVPLDVYNRNAHRNFLRRQRRYEKQVEEQRLENERREKEIADIQRQNSEIRELVINMHNLDQKVLCKTIFSKLTPIEQLVLYRRYYQNQTYASIADEVGRSLERVRQIELKARRHIKHRLFRGQL